MTFGTECQSKNLTSGLYSQVVCLSDGRGNLQNNKLCLPYKKEMNGQKDNTMAEFVNLKRIESHPKNITKSFFKIPSPFKSGLVQGDILKLLAKHPKSVPFDVIIADPPYNIGKNFGNRSDKMPMDDYLQWSEKWISMCLDLLAHNGIMYIYGFTEILARIAVKFPIEEQRWLAWHYTNKTVPSSSFWQRSHESILCLWKPGSKRPALEINQIREPYTNGYKVNLGRTRAGTESRFGSGVKTVYQDHGGALPRDVIKIPALAGGAGASERWFLCRDCKRKIFPPDKINEHRGHDILKHPTQKPMELTRRLIQSKIKKKKGYTLIPFAGSGSECLVASHLGVQWRGIEINPEYVEFAKKWIKACTS